MVNILAATEIDPSQMTPGAGGLVAFLFLLIAGFFLFRSLKKQLSRVDFEEAPKPQPTPTDQKSL